MVPVLHLLIYIYLVLAFICEGLDKPYYLDRWGRREHFREAQHFSVETHGHTQTMGIELIPFSTGLT